MNFILHEQAPRVMDICSDAAEVLALSIIRFLATGYATGDVACWDAAFVGAEQGLGAEAGGRLVASLVSLVRALRAERIGGWMFMPATCCRATDDETAIMHLIGIARAGDTLAARKAAADLARRSTAPVTESAAHGVAAVVDEIAMALPLEKNFRPRSPPSVH